jgi:hypothetical protein
MRRYTDLELACAVAESRRMADVLRKLNLVPRGANYETVWRQIRDLNLDTSHFIETTRPDRNQVWKVPEEAFVAAVASTPSRSATLRRLGLSTRPCDIKAVGKRIMKLGLDIDHFTGQGWRKGNCTPIVPPIPLKRVLVQGKAYNSNKLRQRLIKEGLKQHACENCGLKLWRDQAIPLELDHLNGLRDDNRLVNLRLVCPNCHAQTDNYRGRNIGQRA